MKYNFIFYYFFFYGFLQLSAAQNQNTKTEEDFNKSSSVFLVSTDSVFKTNYIKITELKADEQYVKALKLSCDTPRPYSYISPSLYCAPASPSAGQSTAFRVSAPRNV